VLNVGIRQNLQFATSPVKDRNVPNPVIQTHRQATLPYDDFP